MISTILRYIFCYTWFSAIITIFYILFLYAFKIKRYINVIVFYLAWWIVIPVLILMVPFFIVSWFNKKYTN